MNTIITGRRTIPCTVRICSRKVFPAGRLHMVQYSYIQCDSERDKQYTVDARCFFFNGTTTGIIEIRSQNGVDEIRKMVKHIIQKTAEFPFSSLL